MVVRNRGSLALIQGLCNYYLTVSYWHMHGNKNPFNWMLSQNQVCIQKIGTAKIVLSFLSTFERRGRTAVALQAGEEPQTSLTPGCHMTVNTQHVCFSVSVVFILS